MSSDPFFSLERPYVTLRITTVPGRGFMLTLTDPQSKVVTTPTISSEAIARALEDHHVSIRNGGFAVEFTPSAEGLHIKGGPLAGLQLEGVYRPQDIESALKSATERLSIA